MDLTAERLRELLSYDPLTGIFTRKIRTTNCIKIGDIAGGKHETGYYMISVDAKLYYSHRLAWLYVFGRWPTIVDHINHNRADNRIANIRECTPSENQQNLRGAKTKGGVLGVHFDTWSGRWRAAIKANGKQMRLGRFNTMQEAENAYREAKKLYHPFVAENVL